MSVGNLTVGGTGKTPMVEYLIKRLVSGPDSTAVLATLSRGYGRWTKGFRMATDADTADTIGDEPLQIYRKFGRPMPQRVRVCVGERRADAIRQLLGLHPDTSAILLDDAFQHRAVRPHINLLLTDYNRPFYLDYPFPAGRLREGRQGASRADAVIVTKCPDELSADEQQPIRAQIRRYAPTAPVYFAGLSYSRPVSFATHQPTDSLRRVILVSGLASAGPLEQYVRRTFDLVRHHRFADHYVYTRAELERIMNDRPPGAALLTTEKDWVKLDSLLTPDERSQWPLFYLPVAVRFLGDELPDRFLQVPPKASP